MISWVIIIILVVLVFFFLRMRHMKHKFTAVLIILLLLFMYITVSSIIQANQVDLKSFNGIVNATKLYFVWLGNAFSNLKVIAGNVIHMDWSTNSTGLS